MRDALRPGDKVTGRKLHEALGSGTLRDGGHTTASHLDGQATITNIKPEPRRDYRFFARITEYEPGIGADGYGFEEIVKTGTGYGGWATLAGGRTHISTGWARNITEENDSVHQYGIDLSTHGLFSIQRIPVGRIVEMILVYGQDTGFGPWDYIQNWFAALPGYDGNCGEAATPEMLRGRIEWNTQKILEVERSLGYVAGKG
ncbi:MAG: hypothetical protein KJO36_06125 [Acidimicrobiia bacterium]|nr:hypothetical protein [Acidimicrobiia bacterium]